MRKPNITNKQKFADNFWRRRPSELRGYTRTIYTTTDNNEYLRVDYNLQEKKVRLYIEDNEEGGNPYFSVITNGKITIERNATTGRVTDLHDKFSRRADVFSTIPNKDVIKLIDFNYNIGTNVKKLSDYKESLFKNKSLPQQEKQKSRTQSNAAESDPRRAVRKKKKKTGFVDIVDTSVGILLCTALFIYNHNFVTLGVLSAFIGIFMGLLDVYYRERHPVFIKMILFLLAGMIFYIYGYYIL